MPVYLVHGFRWPREGFSGIRVHAIVHNLEDCSVEYIQNENSRHELLGSFRKVFAEIMKDLEVQGRSLEFIEQYDPEDTDSAVAVSQPFAYVADKVIELAGRGVVQPQLSNENPEPAGPLLSVNVEEVIADGPGLTTKAWEAMADLRDKIATGEKIGWWVVYNGDPDRAYDSDYDEEEEDKDEEEEEEATTPTAESIPSATTSSSGTGNVPSSSEAGPPVPPKPPTHAVATKPLPTRSKPEPREAPKPEVVKPEAVLPSPKEEKIPEPSKLKETAKSSGFRKKFFGRKI